MCFLFRKKKPEVELDPIITTPIVIPEDTGSPQSPNWKYLWDSCVIDENRKIEISKICNRISLNKDTYVKIAEAIPCHWAAVGLTHYRESGALTLDVYLHNGQKLGSPTTIVPIGIYFRKDQFIEAAIDAMKDFKNCFDPWSICEKAERFNGLGYRKRIGDHGVIEYSPYVVAGTNHSDETGKYISDGKYSPTAIEQQLGVMAILKGLLG